MTPTIVLVKGNDMMRTALRKMLEIQCDFVVVEEVPDGLSADSATSHCQPDIVVLDLVLPLQDSLAVVQRIRAHSPSTQVILLALYLRSEDVQQAMRAGAQGIVLYEKVSNELSKAIHRVHAGERYLSRELVEYEVAAPPMKQSRLHRLGRRMDGGGDALQNTLAQS